MRNGQRGRSLNAAQAEMTAIAAALEAAHPATNSGVTVFLEPRHDVVALDSRPRILVAWGGVALLLLIASANVANLF